MDYTASSFMTQQPSTDVCVTPDIIMLTDMLSDDFIAKLESMTLANSQSVIVCIDHDTPNSSIEVGAKQRRLIDWAVSQGLTLEKNRGVGYLRLLAKHVKPDQIIVGTGRHMSGFAAAGALGLTLTEEQLADVLQQGSFAARIPAALTVALTGELAEGTAAQDAALALLAQLKKVAAGKLLVLTGTEKLTDSQCYDFCHLLAETGAVSVLPGAGDAAADLTFDLGSVQPLVALPGSLDELVPVAGVTSVHVDEVFLGGCRGGKIEDLRVAASILKGKQVARAMRLVVSPATSDIYMQALDEGLIDIFLAAGAVVMNQGCSVCWGKAQGILDAGEVLVSTGSYNYAGCSGDAGAKVYLASPAVAAACALTGRLAE